MLALDFVNKFDKSTMTDPEIISIVVIYKDKNEITVCFGFECSSASEGVRAKQKELSVSVGRVDLKLVKREFYLSGSRTAIDRETDVSPFKPS